MDSAQVPPMGLQGQGQVSYAHIQITFRGFKNPKDSKSSLKRWQSGGAESTDLCANPDLATY